MIDPNAQESVSRLAQELGPNGAAELERLAGAAAAALIAGVRVGYMLGLAGAVVVLVLVIILPVPDYRRTGNTTR